MIISACKSKNDLENYISCLDKNNLKDFKKFLIENKTVHAEYISAIQYSYNLDLQIVNINKDGDVTKANPSELMQLIMDAMFGSSMEGFATDMMPFGEAMMGGGIQNNFCEIVPANDGAVVNEMIYNQYDLKEMRNKDPHVIFLMETTSF